MTHRAIRILKYSRRGQDRYVNVEEAALTIIVRVLAEAFEQAFKKIVPPRAGKLQK
jgi:hypothetical protein